MKFRFIPYRRKKFLVVGLVWWMGLVHLWALHQYLSSSVPKHQGSSVNVTNTWNGVRLSRPRPAPTRCWFESDEAYELRLQLAQVLEGGVSMKMLFREHYLRTTGYDEGYYDSLPLIREVPAAFKPNITFCENHTYDHIKPTKISIVMHYFNEPLSLVLRTVYSALRSTPPAFLEEVIVLDDGSTEPDETGLIIAILRALAPHVRYERNTVASGLVPARRTVLTMATGEYVFLVDAHVELHDGWYLPLLNITQENYRAVVAPVINLYYHHIPKMVFNDKIRVQFSVFLNWETGKASKGGAPFTSGAIMGGAYLIARRRLQELDYIGRGLTGYGRENIEVGLKSWLCGGEVWTVPCSSVTHFSALRTPETHPGRPVSDNILHNPKVLAESFFDDEHLLRVARIRWQSYTITDNSTVEFNRKLASSLGCGGLRRVFQTIMPEIELFTDEDSGGYLLTVNGHLTQFHETAVPGRAPTRTIRVVRDGKGVYHGQVWKNVRYTKTYLDIRASTVFCLDKGFGLDPLYLHKCTLTGKQGNQAFIYHEAEEKMQAYPKQLCLDVNEDNDLKLSPCNTPHLPKINFLYKNYSEAFQKMKYV